MKYKDIKEASMGLNVTASGTRSVPTLKSKKILEVTKAFTATYGGSMGYGGARHTSAKTAKIKPRDTIYNLPGGIFWFPNKLSDWPSPEPAGTNQQYGIPLTRTKENISAIVKNTKTASGPGITQ